jgi:hypothetical protein
VINWDVSELSKYGVDKVLKVNNQVMDLLLKHMLMLSNKRHKRKRQISFTFFNYRQYLPFFTSSSSSRSWFCFKCSGLPLAPPFQVRRNAFSKHST